MEKKSRELLDSLPKVKLSFLPTPLHRLPRLSDELGVDLWMKRDDLSGISQFGGNKMRKLEYLLGDALARGCDTVFTYGATQSNHAMETAEACRMAGLTPILYLVAVVEPEEDDLRANLLLDEILGAEVHIVRPEEGETEEEAEERSFALAKEQMKRLEAEGHRCYDIPMGGANGIGSCGFIEGYVEMTEQMQQMDLGMPDFVFHATGTGGTMAGLAAGRALTEAEYRTYSHEAPGTHDTEIVSVTVSPKDQPYLEKVESMANEALAVIGAEPDLRVHWQQDLHYDRNYYAPGYEMPNARATEAIRLLARSEGILVDPVYTGKAFAGMLDYIRTGRVPKGSTVVFWHTGGATALFAEKSILGNLV